MRLKIVPLWEEVEGRYAIIDPETDEVVATADSQAEADQLARCEHGGEG
jgi:hypothetical protein